VKQRRRAIESPSKLQQPRANSRQQRSNIVTAITESHNLSSNSLLSRDFSGHPPFKADTSRERERERSKQTETGTETKRERDQRIRTEKTKPKKRTTRGKTNEKRNKGSIVRYTIIFNFVPSYTCKLLFSLPLEI
jgi:hypothetical protein